MIYTFTLHPENILRKELSKLITSREKKITGDDGIRLYILLKNSMRSSPC